ncbi:unnamed protein product [Phytophthora fragariaefolia]|uniref:Unnamed protein product n=1 Tax=Phytophthora fragariaefolia TaxID=1490495 RepID=A0A9W6XX51_9STRA|nr:unnamed protein product [Phytophthora fragariaefolia]
MTRMRLERAVEVLIHRALDEGFPADKVERLRTIVYAYDAYDVWRLVLGKYPPANVGPMRVRTETGCRPYKVKARKYAPEYQVFLDPFNEMLVKLGRVYENPTSRWVCAAPPVRKRGAGDFRQTVGYKPFNAQTEPMAGLIPNSHVDLENVRGSNDFGFFDYSKGYWQLPLAKECQMLLYVGRSIPNATVQLYKHLLVWIADLLLYAANVDMYLNKLQEMLELTAMFGFKLSVSKSCVNKREVKWCGKVINGEGVKHASERIQALQSMLYPTNAGELQQFLCSTNWMGDSIVDYARLALPLQDTLDKAMAQT